ncbi:hypothetical protein HK097_000910 [Rhizophlyctis rosea]|uniref:25S rRNA (Uridine(2843)-N(3))-methyltransferase n=1 Tax=Rhizophlyctis rosea TaxID=64517 RepID=A0AAD5S4Y5_9FUNG|nr:hypothetical protein HK097_000910 [Rhizophlyctis rosea]
MTTKQNQRRTANKALAKRDTSPPPDPDPELTALLAKQRELLHPGIPEQALLNTITNALSTTFTSPDFATHLRTIKSLFYDRKYVEIFTNADLLPVYAAEYIPGRALCYRDLFMKRKELRDAISRDGAHVYCLGSGNGSELMGIAGALVGMHELPKNVTELDVNHVTKSNSTEESKPPHITIHCQDLSSYGPVLPSLLTSITTILPIPPSLITLESSTHDLLTHSTPLQTTQLQSATLITALFLFNELLTTSKSQFIRFISEMIQTTKPGTLLLVVDSAGSFSEVTIGSEKRTYMVYHLLDAIGALECLVKEDSIWYRFPEALKYPLKINNMRYFLRLYRKR